MNKITCQQENGGSYGVLVLFSLYNCPPGSRSRSFRRWRCNSLSFRARHWHPWYLCLSRLLCKKKGVVNGSYDTLYTAPYSLLGLYIYFFLWVSPRRIWEYSIIDSTVVIRHALWHSECVIILINCHSFAGAPTEQPNGDLTETMIILSDHNLISSWGEKWSLRSWELV